MKHSFTVKNLGECQRLASATAQACKKAIVIELNGTLGAGKTQWARYFVEAMGGDIAEVSSPTFVLMKKYSARLPIYHLDLYRLRDEDELLELGFEEMADDEAVLLIEWADRFSDVMPREKLTIHLEVVDDACMRQVEISAHGSNAEDVLNSIQQSLRQ